MINLKKLKAEDRLLTAIFGLEDGSYFEEITKEQFEKRKENKKYDNEGEKPTIIEYHAIRDTKEKDLNKIANDEDIIGYERCYYVGSGCIARTYLMLKRNKERLARFEEMNAPKLIIEDCKRQIDFYKNVLDDMVKKVGEE